jgi:hypothetical protein
MSGRRIVIAGLLVIAFLGFLLVLGSVIPEDRASFAGKLLRFNKELTIQDFSTREEISDNFRGYEAAKTFEDYQAGGPKVWLIGRGFGHKVDIGLWVINTRWFPIMHNSIAYLVVKSGAIGLGLFLISFLYLFFLPMRFTHVEDKELCFIARTIQGIVAFNLVGTWIVSGPFNKNLFISSLYLLGFFLAVFYRRTQYINNTKHADTD